MPKNIFPESLVAQLSSTELRTQVTAIESLGDLLEFGHWSSSEAAPLLQHLIQIVVQSPEIEAQEAALNTLCLAFGHGDPGRLDLTSLAVDIESMSPDLIPYVFEILGMSGDRSWIPLLERFTVHRVDDVAESARRACEALRAP